MHRIVMLIPKTICSKTSMGMYFGSKMSNNLKNLRERTEKLRENSYIDKVAMYMSSHCFDLWRRACFLGLHVTLLHHSSTDIVFFKIGYILAILLVFKCLFSSSSVCLSWLCDEFVDM